MEDITQLWLPDDIGERGYCPDVEAYETHRPSHSQLLGPDGEPLAYDLPTIGFDMRPRS